MSRIEDEFWRGKEYAFFSHKKCEAFPCHADGRGDNFNCLFCYCPLYILGSECGGTHKYMQNGVKDCSSCTIPHERDNYGYITSRFGDIAHKMLQG
ncbi:MAG: cysteine-rich small domain-containing protein [Oscillospiraceae bacterium]|nr:cysteine-rich small domain-containing protein [Oscillospiraceae bacterium]